MAKGWSETKKDSLGNTITVYHSGSPPGDDYEEYNPFVRSDEPVESNRSLADVLSALERQGARWEARRLWVNSNIECIALVQANEGVIRGLIWATDRKQRESLDSRVKCEVVCFLGSRLNTNFSFDAREHSKDKTVKMYWYESYVPYHYSRGVLGIGAGWYPDKRVPPEHQFLVDFAERRIAEADVIQKAADADAAAVAEKRRREKYERASKALFEPGKPEPDAAPGGTATAAAQPTASETVRRAEEKNSTGSWENSTRKREENNKGRKELEDRLRQLTAIEPIQRMSYPVVVNYDQSLTEMIATGGYDYCDRAITSVGFPSDGSGQGEVTIELVHFGCETSGEIALKSLDTIGLRAATLHELLALGAAYPDVQREYPIVALGPIEFVLSSRAAPYLYGDDSRRSLLLLGLYQRAEGYFRFAGVRKSSVTGAVTPFCHQCGVEIGDPEARYCWSCGAHQNEAHR